MEAAIQVAVRVRPVSANRERDKVALSVTSDVTVSVIEGDSYAFDMAFGEDAKQDALFEKVARRIVVGCVDGCNGTIFAYGQTGSGKTHTMVGPPDAQDLTQRGIIQRSSELLFQLLHEKQRKEAGAFQFSVCCSFVQLYMERFSDLLSDSTMNLTIRADETGFTRVQGAVVRQLHSPDDLLSVLHEGLHRRRVAETAMNETSSRSHAVLTLDVSSSTATVAGITHSIRATLNLVDLAGSERQKDAKTTGERVREASSINTSLLVLGRVIRTLSDPDYHKGSFVAYRDSCLTFLLRDSLGGNARTAVIATVHPNASFLEESLSTLRFARDAKKVTNLVVVNEAVNGENAQAWTAEINRLRAALREAQQKAEQREAALEECEKLRVALANAEKKATEKEKELLQTGFKLRLREASLAIFTDRSAPDLQMYLKEQEAGTKELLAIMSARASALNKSDDERDQLQQLADIAEKARTMAAKAEHTCRELSEALEREKAERAEERAQFGKLKHDLDEQNASRARRSSFYGAQQLTPTSDGAESLKTPAQLRRERRERRTTRYTMGSSSVSRSGSKAVCLLPVVENDAFVADDGDVADPSASHIQELEERCAHLESAQLLSDMECNRLTQINSELSETIRQQGELMNTRLVEHMEEAGRAAVRCKELQAEKDRLQDALEGAARELEQHRQRVRVAEALVADARSECERLRLEAYSLEANVKQQTTAVIQLKDTKAELEASLEAKSAQLRMLEKSLSDERAKQKTRGGEVVELNARLDQKLADLELLKKEVVKQKQRADNLDRFLAELKDESINKDDVILELRGAQAAHEKELQAKRERIEQLSTQLAEARGDTEKTKSKLGQRLKDATSELESLHAEHDALVEAVFNLSAPNLRRRSRFANALDALADRERHVASLERDLREAEEQLKDAEDKLRAAEQERDAAAEDAERATSNPTHRNRAAYMTRLRTDKQALTTRITELEKENIALKLGGHPAAVEPKARMMTRRGALIAAMERSAASDPADAKKASEPAELPADANKHWKSRSRKGSVGDRNK